MTAASIPALTLWQPWASLVAVGAKTDETRPWRAPATLQPGSLLAIHAATRSLRTCWHELLLKQLRGLESSEQRAGGATRQREWSAARRRRSRLRVRALRPH